MNWLRRGVSWFLDYVYVGWWQLRHAVVRGEAAGYGGGDRSPVLLLPGVYETWKFLRPLADELHRLGHPIHVIDDLGYNRGPVAKMAAVAQAYVDLHDLRGVSIVAHSKGGLIGKHMMMIDDRDGRIDRLVAISTPFSGSRYALRTPSRTLRQFSPRDKTLTMLAENLEINSRITSIYAEFDPHIPGGSELPGATNVRLPMAGHFRPIGSPEMLSVVSAALA
ncbi:triacylglycerol lipase [Cryobacterium sp. BB736]|uniref:esterase/lipase family protein n=1 Tax=Cryobacterium sp. BB736 TaxID=2746963 RepID=UPI001874990E|nr:alpha/beta hydrolase [Cryobacterium sp. BB736]